MLQIDPQELKNIVYSKGLSREFTTKLIDVIDRGHIEDLIDIVTDPYEWFDCFMECREGQRDNQARGREPRGQTGGEPLEG